MIVAVKNDFTVEWNCTKQEYRIFKGMKHIRTVFRFRDAAPYVE